ncbi:MAG: 16S rRNA (adenine(1518)-N(6)/adenine(1519)-N(6))-dimethyltransferase RsmA [Methanobacteriota archaeon]
MDPNAVRRLFTRSGMRPRRSLGQHFLVDARVAERQVAHAHVGRTDAVLEIGPGLGILTARLASVAKRVVAIEADRRLVGYLRDAVPEAEIVHGDALEVDWPSFDAMVSNLPYRISSPVTFKLLDQPFDRAVLMYQREFANRMVARPGTPDYSRLTVGVYRRAACEILERVPRNAFRPQPRIDSTIVRLRRRPPPFDVPDPVLYDDVVAALFGQRRKTIENGLRLAWASFEPRVGSVERVLPALPFRRRRIEELRPEDIASLVDSMLRAKA